MARKIHQLLHTLSYGDAISGETLALQKVFHNAGWESEIFAINVHPKLEGRARSYKELPAKAVDQIVLHYSLGSPLNQTYLAQQAQRTLIYHNLTPAKWFEGVNGRIVRDIESGLRELPELCRASDTLVADSKFNAKELSGLGFSSEVLELPIDPQRWEIEANSGIASLVQGSPGIHLLHVGRLAPNKCVEDIIKSFYFLHHFVEPRSVLWLVGIDIDTELYSFELKRLVHELDLDRAVNFAGCMADSEIKALYQNCTAYICMSEHEGYCLPLVEAMHYGLPVIAYASSAVPDTLGQAGILLSEKRHPEIAELIAEVARNEALRARIVASGKARVTELSFEKFETQAQKIFSNAGIASPALVGAR